MKKKKILFFTIFVVMGLLVFVFVQRTRIKEIKFNQTYSITTEDGSISYISFIDQENYVSINDNLSQRDSKYQPYRINYVKGKYIKEKNKIQVGTEFKRTTLVFYGKKNFTAKKYDEIYYAKNPTLYDFESGNIKKEGNIWIYNRKDRDKKVKYTLKKANKKIPPSLNKFLKDFSVQKNNVSEIKYGETYTFLQDQKSYIKFLDKENYVAIPGMRSIKDSLGDGDTYDILYIKGKYFFDDGKYYLGDQVQVTMISFYDKKNIRNHKYDEILSSNEQNYNDFGVGTIELVDQSWIYRRDINEDLIVDYPLRKSDKYIPESTEEFLSNYEENDSE